MSQAKVDRNKEEKRNVKKIMAREKRNWMITQAVLIAIGVAVIGWIGVALYQAVNAPSSSSTPVQSVTYTVDTSAIETYLNSLEEL